MYDVVKQSLEEFIAANWTETQVQYDNVAFNSDLYEEYAQFTVRFGELIKRSLPKGCYRQPGILIFTIKTKPDLGTARKLALAADVATMLTDVVVSPTPPLVAPSVTVKEPALFDDNRQRDGWVMAQLSFPFYYDLEI